MRLVSLIALAVTVISVVSCGPDTSTQAWAIEATGGNPQRGRIAFEKYGCVACHTIDGVQTTESWVGPPLTHMASRSYLAGMLPNSAANLILWIRKPHDL